MLISTCMECFRCEQIVPENDWKCSQWNERCPIVYPYVGCKNCNEPGPTIGMNIAYANARAQMRRALNTDEEGRAQTEFLIEFRSRQWEFSQHKSLSHHSADSALPAGPNLSTIGRNPWCPRHWDDHDGLYYFDPGNRVYARAMQRACPDFLMRTGMSDQKKIADCIRAVLQLDWTLRRSLRVKEEQARSRAALHEPWPESDISVDEAARFWRAFSFQTWFIDWVDNWPTW